VQNPAHRSFRIFHRRPASKHSGLPIDALLRRGPPEVVAWALALGDLGVLRRKTPRRDDGDRSTAHCMVAAPVEARACEEIAAVGAISE